MSGPLTAGALDPSLLYLFVLGPGFGECVLIRVPPDQWIVIDSFEIADRPAAEEILDQYGGSVALVALTHPHKDHSLGVITLLDDHPPARIGCVHPRREVYEPGDLRDPVEQLKECAKPTYRRIWDEWEEDPSKKWETFRGRTFTIADATLQSVHPTASVSESMWNSQHVNDLSSAMRLKWHDTTLLLGADVTNRSWPSIAEFCVDLPAHHAMKLPHHVSTKAIDASFGAGDRDRLWIGTPYARGWGLPPKSADGGLAKALGFVNQVHLTSLPYAHDCDDHAPCQTTRESIQKNLLPRRTDTPTNDPDVQAERLIVAGFNTKGERVSLHHGRGTLEVSAP